jgi:hypothetical protein
MIKMKLLTTLSKDNSPLSPWAHTPTPPDLKVINFSQKKRSKRKPDPFSSGPRARELIDTASSHTPILMASLRNKTPSSTFNTLWTREASKKQ